MKIFYSWQSDTPNNIGRTFIRDCLDKAIADLEVDEAERRPSVDQDTAGVLGSPVIADTIFQKIRGAQVVVADVTLTGQTPEGKRLANSNVAIELGFAIGIHGDEVLLKVMNTHYGSPQELPFDLAHRRWPVQFHLVPGASASERQKERDALARTLGRILQTYVEAKRPAPEMFARAPSTFNPAAYWGNGESLIEDGRTGHPLSYGSDQPLVYLRLWPRESISPLTIQTLRDYSKSSIEPLCGTVSGWSTSRNKYGTATYATSGSGLNSTTQVFKSGEIWGINAWLLRRREARPDFLPVDDFESGVRESLGRYLEAARKHYGYPSIIEVECGLVNVANFKLAADGRFGIDWHGPIYEDVKASATVNTDVPETLTAALLKIFQAVHEAAGVSRPPNYKNFPPKS